MRQYGDKVHITLPCSGLILVFAFLVGLPYLTDRIGTVNPHRPPDNVQWTVFTVQDGLIGNDVHAIWGNERAIWFGTTRGLSRYDGINWTSFTRADGLAGDGVQAIWGDEKGTVWVGTSAGLSRYDGYTWHTFTHADGLPSDNVRSIWGDQEGHLWVATEPAGEEQPCGGIGFYDGEKWQSLLEATPYQYSLTFYQELTLPTWEIYAEGGGHFTFAAARSVMGDADGHIWVGHGLALGDKKLISGGISRYDKAGWRRFTTQNSAIPDDNINAIWVGPDGSVWVGTSRKGICRFNGKSWQIFGTAAAGETILAIWGDRQGNVWIGSWLEGVTRYDGQTWRQFTVTDGLPSPIVQAIWGDLQGRIWVGTPNGVALYSPQQWDAFRIRNGLPSNTIEAIWGDDRGGLWLGADGAGLARYRAGQWQVFTQQDGLPGNRVTDIWGSSENDVWATFGGDGVAHFDGYRWHTLQPSYREAVRRSFVYGVWGDENGVVWFATDAGLSRFDGQKWQTFTTLDGLAADSVTKVVGDQAGNLWMSHRFEWAVPPTFGRMDMPGVVSPHYPGGVSRYDGRLWTYFGRKDGLPEAVWAIWPDQWGNVWVGEQVISDSLTVPDGGP